MKINHAIITGFILGCVLLTTSTVQASPDDDRKQNCHLRCIDEKRECEVGKDSDGKIRCGSVFLACDARCYS